MNKIGICVLIAFTLAACGGGGGSSDNKKSSNNTDSSPLEETEPPASTKSEWDSGKWHKSGEENVLVWQ